MIKKSVLIFIFALIAITPFAKAQPQLYYTAIGLNMSYNYGLTLKHYMSTRNMDELIGNFNYGPGLTILYERNNRHPFNIDNFDWFYGVGAHVKFVNGRKANVFYADRLNHTTLGFDAILGLEYTFKESPFNLGINVKPEFNLTTKNPIWVDGALTLRYVLK